MTDPKRLLLGDGDEAERRLLAAAVAEEPPADGARRLALALGVSAAGLSSLGSAKASSGALSKVAGSKLAAKIALALLIGGGATLAVTWQERTPVEPSAPSKPAATAPAVPQAEQTQESAAPEDAPSQQPVTGARSIADEVARLDAARGALSARDPDQALSTLDAYARSYARGTLRPEAERLRIEAWLAKGDAARARSLARGFLRVYPQSPYAANMRRIAEGQVE